MKCIAIRTREREEGQGFHYYRREMVGNEAGSGGKAWTAENRTTQIQDVTNMQRGNVLIKVTITSRDGIVIAPYWHHMGDSTSTYNTCKHKNKIKKKVVEEKVDICYCRGRTRWGSVLGRLPNGRCSGRLPCSSERWGDLPVER